MDMHPIFSEKEYLKQFLIACRELYIVVVMLKTWCLSIANKRITLHIDNQLVVHSINNGVCVKIITQWNL